MSSTGGDAAPGMGDPPGPPPKKLRLKLKVPGVGTAVEQASEGTPAAASAPSTQRKRSGGLRLRLSASLRATKEQDKGATAAGSAQDAREEPPQEEVRGQDGPQSTGMQADAGVAPRGPVDAAPCVESRDDTDIFILAGQSNMAGRGGVTRNPESGWKSFTGEIPHIARAADPDEKLEFWDADGAWKPADVLLHKNIDTAKANGIGPGLVFARTLRKYGGVQLIDGVITEVGDSTPGNPATTLSVEYSTRGPEATAVGLVPCAVGGTEIALWAPGAKLYEDMIARTRAALAARPGGRLAGLLWYQGESDADTPEHVATHHASMLALFNGVRQALSAPELPIVLVAITSTNADVAPFEADIRRIQLNFPKASGLPFCAATSAKGLELQSDGLHLTTEAQLFLGQRLALTFIDLVEGM